MKLMVSVFGLAVMLMIFSCDGTGTRNNETDNDTLNGDNLLNTNDQWDQERTNEFVQSAANIGMKEVRSGEIAQQNAQQADVREYAQMLVTEHRKANQELKNIAQQMNATVPDSLKSDDKNKMNDLQQANQNDFRKKFLEMMIKDHEDAIDKFEEARENVQNQQLRTWVDNQLPTLRRHLEHARRLNEQSDQQQQQQ